MHGYALDDLVCHSHLPNSSTAKAQVQIKRTLKPRKSVAAFKDAIEAAWRDFGNGALFQRGTDSLSVVYDGHGDSVMRGAETLVARARASLSGTELATKVAAAKFLRIFKPYVVGEVTSARAASRRVFALAAKIGVDGRAIFRLRRALLEEVAHRYATHARRPGVMRFPRSAGRAR